MTRLLEDRPIAAIEGYFEAKGLVLRVHTSPPKAPSGDEMRRMPRAVRRAIETDTSTHWTDLGPVRHYGSGHSPDEAIRAAAMRYRIEQAPEDVGPN